jgi:hypothetical protein
LLITALYRFMLFRPLDRQLRPFDLRFDCKCRDKAANQAIQTVIEPASVSRGTAACASAADVGAAHAAQFTGRFKLEACRNLRQREHHAFRKAAIEANNRIPSRRTAVS